MVGKQITDAIRYTVQEQVSGARVLLFGSRARGDQQTNSDYDLLIVTPTTLPQLEKTVLKNRLNHLIIQRLNIPVDLLINSQDELQKKSLLPGHITRTALKEGRWL